MNAGAQILDREVDAEAPARPVSTNLEAKSTSDAKPPKRREDRGLGPVKVPLAHRIAERLIHIMAFTAVAAIVLIFVFIAREGLPLLWEHAFAEEVRLQDLIWPREWAGYDAARAVWQPVGGEPKFNVLPLFAGSLKITAVAMLISVPLGVGSALYVTQRASERAREILKPMVELLAAIPSVVIGFFVLMVLASVTQNVFGLTFRLNALVAGMGLSLAIVPLIFTVSEDAIRSVPSSYRDAALALGARPYQVSLRVILPAATPGIFAATVLGFGRAIGETMIVLMASGNAAIVDLLDPSKSARTVTATIAAELGEVAQGDPHWRILFMLGVCLFAFTFVVNLVGGYVMRRLHSKAVRS